MYGKFQHETSEFRHEVSLLFDDFLNRYPSLNMKIHNDIIKLRNSTVALVKSWIGSKRLENKFGIKIPLHATPPSLESFLEKQRNIFKKKYKPCEICGEKRITNYGHILPYSFGGPNDEKNYVYLCPTHHHLFDHNRLSEEEWQRLDFSKKLKASRDYVEKVKLPVLRKFWRITKRRKYRINFK
jgi:hypothetical protein